LLAALAVKEFRPIILNPWMLLTVAIAALLVWPHAQWMQENKSLVLSSVRKLHVQSEGSMLTVGWNGLYALAEATIADISSIFVIMVLLCWKQWVPFPRRSWQRPDVRMLCLFAVSALAVTALVVLGSRATNFKGRWLLPVYICIPLLCTALVHERLTPAALRRITVATWLIALGVLAFLPLRIRLADRFGYVTERTAPFPALAPELRADAERSDVILADTPFLAGNLRLLFPGRRIITPQFATLPQPARGRTLVVFNAAFSDRPGPSVNRVLQDMGSQEAEPEVRFVARPYSSAARELRLGVQSVPFDRPATAR